MNRITKLTRTLPFIVAVTTSIMLAPRAFADPPPPAPGDQCSSHVLTLFGGAVSTGVTQQICVHPDGGQRVPLRRCDGP
jgi:hypothetical protein